MLVRNAKNACDARLHGISSPETWLFLPDKMVSAVYRESFFSISSVNISLSFSGSEQCGFFLAKFRSSRPSGGNIRFSRLRESKVSF